MTIYRSGSSRSYSVRTSFYKGAVYYVIEHRHDGERFPSTGRMDRVVSGPWLYGEQAQQDAQHRADVAASLVRTGIRV